jgi:hypothetical protein
MLMDAGYRLAIKTKMHKLQAELWTLRMQIRLECRNLVSVP